MDIDVMTGFAINHRNGVFEYIFDPHSITDFILMNGVSIPFTSSEDWYVIYPLIPGRESKVNKIQNHIQTNGIKNRFLLERSLEGNLPKEGRKKIEIILSS